MSLNCHEAVVIYSINLFVVQSVGVKCTGMVVRDVSVHYVVHGTGFVGAQTQGTSHVEGLVVG